jgi:hypothetical protein
LKELARAAAPAATVQPGAFEASLTKAVAAHRDTLASPQGRHELLVELLRESAVKGFEAVRAAPEWRTYLALHATVMSLPDGELRDEIRAVLATSSGQRVTSSSVYRLGVLMGRAGSVETPRASGERHGKGQRRREPAGW